MDETKRTNGSRRRRHRHRHRRLRSFVRARRRRRRRRRRTHRKARPTSTSSSPSVVDSRYASRYDPCEHEWVRPRMRDGTGTFEPMSRDWFATDPRRDAPNAGLTSSSSHPFISTARRFRRRHTRSEEPDPDPIRSDPIQPPPSARMGTDARRRDDSLEGEPIERGTRAPSSPFRRSIVIARSPRKTNKQRNVRIRQTTTYPAGMEARMERDIFLQSLVRGYVVETDLDRAIRMHD